VWCTFVSGISDRHITQYLIGLAKKVSTSEEYISALRATGTVDIDDKMVAFARQLMAKVVDRFSCVLLCVRLLCIQRVSCKGQVHVGVHRENA